MPAEPAASRKVYGYCRVSAVAEADEGESLDVQQRVLAGYAQMPPASACNVEPR